MKNILSRLIQLKVAEVDEYESFIIRPDLFAVLIPSYELRSQLLSALWQTELYLGKTCYRFRKKRAILTQNYFIEA